MLYKEENWKHQSVMSVAAAMLAAAATAPKACGINCLESCVVDGAEKDALSAEMRRLGTENKQEFFIRDAGNVDLSECVVLIGARDEYRMLAHCGYCGLGSCGSTKKQGGRCTMAITDLGIAIGSAVSVAADHRIDSRVMFSAGKAAISLGYLGENVKTVFAIPLSVSEKSPYFDRPPVASASALKK